MASPYCSIFDDAACIIYQLSLIHLVKLRTLTFKDYTYSSSEDRDWILWSRGVKIAERTDTMFFYTLYQVDGFYIELQHTIASAAIIEIRGFDNLELLDPYLQQLVINVNY